MLVSSKSGRVVRTFYYNYTKGITLLSKNSIEKCNLLNILITFQYVRYEQYSAILFTVVDGTDVFYIRRQVILISNHICSITIWAAKCSWNIEY